MSFNATAYRIFIATPGGLDPERQVFRETTEQFNSTFALKSGALFVPVGGEDTPGGKVRPQSRINEEIKSSDYFILMLWDHWGSPPAKNGIYTSGTSEEYHVAEKCYRSRRHPMRDLLVFFKAVDPIKLADPGRDLKKVLKFKKTLEAEKSIYFKTFDALNALQRHLEAHLGSWLENHERGTRSKMVPFSGPRAEAFAELVPLPDISAVRNRPIMEAERLAKAGKIEKAEMILARSISAGNDPDAFTRYGDFLLRVGRLSQAQVMYERVRELAASHGTEWKARAFGRLGLVYRTLGDLAAAEEMFRASLAVARQRKDLKGIAEQLSNLGVVLKRRGDLGGAERLQRKALGIYEGLNDREGIAITSGSLGIVLRKKGRFDDAESLLRQSLQLSERTDNQIGVAKALGNLGLVLQRRGEFVEAEKCFRRSLTINKSMGSSDGVAIQYASLGLLNQSRGRLNRAVKLLLEALRRNQDLGSWNRLAKTYGQLGNVHRQMGELDLARTYFGEAKVYYSRMGLIKKEEDVQLQLDQLLT